MTKTLLHRLSSKYPRTDIRKKKWVKFVNGHWKITKSGRIALMKKTKTFKDNLSWIDKAEKSREKISKEREDFWKSH